MSEDTLHKAQGMMATPAKNSDTPSAMSLERIEL